MQEYTFRKFSQEEIIKGIKSNNSEIIRQFYQSEFKKIEQFILTNNGDREDAKDIYQEAFVVVWKNVRSDKFKPDNRTAINGYIYQIAKNKWLDRLRSSKSKVNMVNLENYEDLPDEDFLSKEDDHDWVVKEFQNLGDSCKEVLKRYYYLKQSMEEIATYFNWTTATARNNKYRCIQALKEKWKSKTSKEL
ncbi:RNA polymerase sigma factor [Mongoliibacter ruber]|uniref:RNA polymerase sigma factor (Sigma-70 family) n=1 Tax=Mongoliibacter ruber TaxID=1750599 RepID=A0A2T0WT36_9BACT|nr:sigma-70 family RNA polymerase sigma factor [Mongoliibacter ruber]PRY89866.1 RNA polymerase sigma factor (sigma-70 family) [Mongoliibacter ruber]